MKKLKNKDYRDSFSYANARIGIGSQLFYLRTKFGFSQNDIAEKSGLSLRKIKMIENGSYFNLKISELCALAKVFDIGLFVHFMSFSQLFEETNDKSPEALTPKSYEERKKMKKLNVFNGRFGDYKYKEFSHAYVCANSKAEVVRMMIKISNFTLCELNNYWHHGAWGNKMNELYPKDQREKGVWLSDQYNKNFIRVIDKNGELCNEKVS